MGLATILLILAAIAFLLAAANAPIPRCNLTALGLFLWVCSILLRGVS